MLDVVKMKEVCRICARELCGNQRRWIFHPAAKLNLQVLLSHALGCELTRDGRGEFACSKCTFMLDRMYRFDTVIARVEALSLERLHKLLLEKDRLRQCIGGLYRKNNAEEGAPYGSSVALVGTEIGSEDSPVVDLSALQDVKYSDMIQEDLTYSVYESWADREDPALDHHDHLHHCPAGDSVAGMKPRRCRGCAALRVADSDYEAVCKVPRRVGRRSTSCGPSTRYSTATLGVEDPTRESESTSVAFEPPSPAMNSDKTTGDHRSPGPASSVESLDTAVDVSVPPANHEEREETEPEKDPEEAPVRRDTPRDKQPSESPLSGLDMTLSLLRGWEYRPVKPQRGSKLPVLVKDKLEQGLSLPLSITLQASCGGAADRDLQHSCSLPEVVTPCPQQELQAELAEMEEQWLDDYVQCGPFCLQQRLIDEQQGQLSQYESAAGQCVSELQKAQDQVQSLQAKIRESETRNQKLQQRLGEMELELRSAQEEAQQQERNIQNLSDTVNSKDAEAAELYSVIEEQNKMLCSLKELANRNQLQVSGAESIRGQGEVLALQASLFQAQLELQAGQGTQRQASRTQEDLNRAVQRLEKDLQGALQHRRETEKHNQELQLALEKARLALQEREEQLRDVEDQRQREKEEREKSIRELKTSLQTKEQLVEDYCALLDDPKEKTDSLLQKLRQRIKERDRALERAVDEKFCCMEEKEEEARRLKLLLREKERDLERQRCVLGNNEETITSLEVLVRGKALELQQVCDALRSVQQQRQESEEKQSRMLRERDAIISQLQTALHTRTQEVQDLRCSLLAKIQSAPADVLEELKVRLQLKDRLFQEVLGDRTRQAQEHQEQVQDLLRTISSRDQYIQDSASRLGEVMTEQTSRLQELRRQLSSGLGSRTHTGPDLAVELQAVQEELRLALRREKENQELSRSRAARLDSLSRTLHVKEEIIRDLQRKMVDPSELPLVERLTQEVEELRESLVQQEAPPARGPVLGRDRPTGRQPEFGGLSSEDEEEADEDDLNSDYTENVDEEESTLGPGKAPSQDVSFEGQGLMEVKQLVEQKRAVERELGELKAQLEKAGFSSLSQMRKALFSLQAENEHLKHRLTDGKRKLPEGEEEDDDGEEELDVTIEGVEEDEEEEEESSEQWEACNGDLSLSQSNIQAGDEQRKNRAARPESLNPLSSQVNDLDSELLSSRQQDAVAKRTCEETVRLQLRSKELKLKDYSEPLTETAVQQDSKQIQVDLQDLGYETCGRSENEAEREDTSSPEFDDLEMCTSLDCGSQWWPPSSSSSSTFTKTTTATQSSSYGDEASSLQRLVEDLRSQLSRSQGVIRGLQSRLRSLSTSSDLGPSTPRKVNWSFQASPSQSGAEDDEGWQSSDGGPLASPHHPHPDRGLQELVSRVDALEDQLRKGGKKSTEQDGKSATWPGKFNTLIQAQARELSHLRQRMREGRGVCNILTQHLGDTTKAFEELLRANDIDYYMGQGFREQLAQSGALAQRVGVKLSGRDQPEDPDEKTELLAIRLSKELQQKDQVIESLRAKLNQHHHRQRSDTPCSSHVLSDTTDQSDRISYVSDERGSTNDDLELCSDVEVASELVQEETRPSTRVSTACHSHSGTMSCHPSVCPSITSSHRAQSGLSCPSMQCSSSPHQPADMQSHTATASIFTSSPFRPPPSSSTQTAPLPFQPHPANYHGSGGAGFSLAEVHQELQMLQRQLGLTDRFPPPQSKPLQGFPFAHQQPDSSGYLPLSFHGYQSSPFSSAASSSLDASLTMKTGASLLESSALWDVAYSPRPVRLGADLSSGSSGYQSGTSHTGSDLMKEHLREIRSLRQRLEDSIHTNDRLRQQLEEKLAHATTEKGAPTNIYIQGLDSVAQLSSEIRLLKEENVSLQNQLKQLTREHSKEVERLREAGLLERARLKEAELEAERWAERGRKLQAEAEAHNQELTQLKKDRQRSQETINRLQHEVSVLQQQLCESRTLVHSLQCELQVNHKVCGVAAITHSGQVSDSTEPAHSGTTFDPRELRVQLEQQLRGQLDTQRRARRQLDNVPSPPVRDTGLVSPSSPLHSVQKPAEQTGAADQASTLQGQAPDGSFANRHGRHVVAHVDDFKALQQQLLEGSALLCKMEATVCPRSSPQEFVLCQPLDSGSVRKLLADTKTLSRILEEAESLLRMFWRAALPSSEKTKQDQSLRGEVDSLRLKISEQEEALRDAMERLKSSNRTKDSMEHFIVSQLSRTRDVLKKAKTNLQENEFRISSLRQRASFSLPPSSSTFSSTCSSSSLPWTCKGENTGSFCELALFSPGWGVMTPRASSSISSSSSVVL
ncbi:Myomegalin Cardiomyopathy-associated protein 2 Phosphodiesterase 4D-interacting protein [Channa argus]|uniref:Myomegalin Cardiomyopathy-associated protein 2 Phosphodiesterase 4D-interacting protein n=1 Tax=Channa argus TaxID=215402 RepID=A0A6G1PJS9_CHAAH|nr:Myomegalin Cardiomyopathy-associated protein 2 Phosphodiesterase 4D-interacting protein [Channa argus]